MTHHLKTFISSVACALPLALAVACNGADSPAQPAVLVQREALSLESASPAREPVRASAAEITRLTAATAAAGSSASGVPAQSFEDAYAALVNSRGQDLALRRDLLVAAVEAVGTLPASQRNAAKLRLVDYYKNGGGGQ
jgi:hypothetical protein